MRDHLLVLLVSFISTCVSGYQFAVSDQEIFIPYIYKINQESLFQNDLLFTQFTATSSLFYYVVAVLTKFIELELLFFICFLLFKFLFFLGVYKIAELIFKKKALALLSLLPFLNPKFIGGTATLTTDTFFTYRTIGSVFLIYFLLFLLRNSFVKASLISAVGLLIHPLSTIPHILSALSIIITHSRTKIRDLVFFSTALLTFAIVYTIIFTTNIDVLHADTEWLSIIKSRDDYLFASLWGSGGWLSIGMFIAFMAYFNFLDKSKNKKIINIITFASLVIFVLNWLALDVLGAAYIAKFQLVRSITPIAILGLIITPLFLVHKNKFLKFTGLIVFASLCLNLFWLMLLGFSVHLLLLFLNQKPKFLISNFDLKITAVSIIVISTIFNLLTTNNFIEYPNNKNDWTDVQVWAKGNTSINSLFLVPPDETGFRILSERPIVADIKDGAVVIYSPVYARQWSQRMQDLENYEVLNTDGIKSLDSKYNFDYVVTKSDHGLGFEKAYSNSTYNVYKK